MEFRTVKHQKPDPIAAHLGFDDDKDSITLGNDVYIRLSACESLPAEEQITTAPFPKPTRSIPLFAPPSGETSDSTVGTNEDPSASTSLETRSRTATEESKDSVGMDECGGDFGITFSIDSQSESRVLNQSATGGHKDSIESTDENYLRPPSQFGSLLRTPSAPILCAPAGSLGDNERLRSSIYDADEEEERDTIRAVDSSALDFVTTENNSFPGTSFSGDRERDLDAVWRPLWSFTNSRYSVFKNDQIDGGVLEPELKFIWSTNISGSHFKVEPSSSRFAKKFDLMIIGITRDDNLPEIWLLSTRRDQRREVFTPKKLSPTTHEPWRLERRSELKCNIKVNSDDSHYIHFILTLETIGEADLVYGKLLEASNYIIFKSESARGHLTTPNEKKSAIEQILNDEVCNQFCAECCSKFIGVFDVWMSLASWSMICTKCSNWHRGFVSSARHLWLDDLNRKTWQAIKTCASALMSHYWYDDKHPDHLIDGYELLREDLDPILKENISERHIYAKYCSLKFLKPESNEESRRQLSDLLYVQLKQKDKNVPKLVDLIFRGATLNEIHRQKKPEDLKQQMTDDRFHQDLMKLVHFVSYTRTQLARKVEVFEVEYSLSPRCLKDFFDQNPNLKSVTLVYSSEQTTALFNKASVKTYKTEIFELIPYPKEPQTTNSPEENDSSRFSIGSPLLKDFYNMFLSRFYAVSYKRPTEIIPRPRKIGVVYLTEEMRETFCRTCAILDNFVLYFFDCSDDKQTPYRELDLRFVYRVTKTKSTPSSVTASTSSLLSKQSEFVLKIDYIHAGPGKSKYPAYYFKVEDEADFEAWFKLISDWINVTQSPLLHRQPIEIHHLGMFCNYAVAILIGQKLMPVTCKFGPRKHWLITSADSLPAYEKQVINRFCFKSDMPRTVTNSSSNRLLDKILSPAAFIQLLVKFTQDHLMIPARFVHRLQKMEQRKTLVISGLDPESISPSLNRELFNNLVNSLSIAYRNTLLELFWYFKVIISQSDDLEVSDVVSWMGEVKFCNNLFSAEVLRHCLENFERIFKVSGEFLDSRTEQIKHLKLLNDIKPGVTLQVPFIRENWSEYDRANEIHYENSLEPIKFNKPDDFESWTNEQYLDALVNCITPLTGSSSVSASVGPRSKELKELNFRVPQIHLLVERLTFDKHVVRILPMAERINESILPCAVVMNGWEFVAAFKMLTREGPKKKFMVDVVKLKWNNGQKQTEKGSTKTGSCDLHVADNTVKFFKKSSTVPDILYLNDYTIYFGMPSKNQKTPWKKSLSIIGDAYCYGLTFENASFMYACFWSLQHHKLGKDGMKKWLPIEKYKTENRSQPRSRQTIDGIQPHSADWENTNNFFATSRASNVISPVSNSNSSNRGSIYIQHEGGDVTANREFRGQSGSRSSRYTTSGSPHLGRLSRSMDLLQEESGQGENRKWKGFSGADRAISTRLSVTRALRKKWSMKRHKDHVVVD